ncbi:MAG: enoyl-CoA hydratase/isomerase family protein, partial [Bacteroidales bacterium]|nr:enoyl-CoA hydratase/isomerase family protein [Bacteroidales bacterium]
MDYQFLKVDAEREGVVVLTISSPSTLNALNSTILGELDAFVDTLDPARTRVLVITGEGKAFVAGADISEMAHLSEAEGLAFGRRGAAVFKKIEDLPFPVIAAVNGFALGGGCELAMA